MFDNIDYLKKGNEKQRLTFKLINDYKIFDVLAVYSPIVAGTIPIEIDIDSSDIDILCCWENKNNFVESLMNFSSYKNFELSSKIINNQISIIAKFEIEDMSFEIFGQNIPTKQQDAYIHLVKEYMILKEMGEEFRQSVIQLKNKGYKTEPAFAKMLGIVGDSYEELKKYII